MNILRMRYFADVARLENITKAAQLNYISQTAMSQQIANIENELELKLFTREKGHLHLTQAGHSFYNDCLVILENYDRAVRKAQEAWKAQYGKGNLMFGVLTSSTVDYLENIIKKFHVKFPEITIKLQQCSFHSMRQDLEQGSLDLAICPDFNLTGIRNINVKILSIENMGFLVPISHPLAKKSGVYISEIKDEKIIMTEPSYAGISYDKMLEERRNAGYEPNITETASSAAIHRTLVALGRGCAFLPERTGLYDPRKCKMLHIIDGNDTNNVSLAWKKTADNYPLNYLASLICDFFKNEFEDWISDYVNAIQNINTP